MEEITTKINYSIEYCGRCPFFRNEDINGHGFCEILEGTVACNRLCLVSHLDKKQVLKVLHYHQKWRRGYKGKMVSPRVIGLAIDESIRFIRKIKEED